MKKEYKIILFALILIVLVAIVVFSLGNAPKTNPVQNTNLSNSSSEVLQPVNKSSVISESELATHNTQANCWIAYNSKVYDITSFLPKHPGSAAAIAPYCGTSSEFQKAFERQHGKTKVSLLMKVGVLMGDFKVVGTTQ